VAAADAIILGASNWLWAAVVGLATLAVVAAWVLRRRAASRIDVAAALEQWQAARAELPDMFLEAAAATGKPRGLRWKSATLADGVLFAIDRASQSLYALAPVTISFDAVAGGPMEEVEAVANLRAATAVFVYRGGRWTTDGRVVFNLEPAEALARFGGSLEPLDGAAG
jgi:hypothetical protein